MWELEMWSDEYGSETFEYASKQEALAGKVRLQKRIAKLNDKVKRSFTLTYWGGEVGRDPLLMP